MRTLPALLTVAALLSSTALAAPGDDCQAPSLLSVAQWQEDITATYDELRSTHPRPYREVSEVALRENTELLLEDLPCLSDQQVFARLAQLVATLRDGHTRLAIPRSDPTRGLGIGHSGTPPPEIALAFAQLPVEFSVFEDGVFVTASTAENARWLGARLLRYAGQDLDPLLDGLATIAFAENDNATRLKVADRLAYPELVGALGLIEPGTHTTLELELPGEQAARLALAPAKPGSAWQDGFGDQLPLHLQQPEARYFASYLPDRDIHYVAITEIGDAPEGPGLVAFFAAQIELAERRDARLVVDLRRNFGGAGDLNRGLLLALLGSDEINQYGRCFMLIGRRTFSAAQHLLNDLEAYSNALFVGEASGSMPDHFGDSKKLQLPHSGLTLRVSTLHWSSWLANDQRRYTTPLISTPWTSALWFAGRDPALEAIAALPALMSPLEVLEQGLLRKDQITVYRVLDRLVNAPEPVGMEFSEALLALGQDLQARNETAAARLGFLYGRYYFPQQAGFTAALEAMGSP